MSSERFLNDKQLKKLDKKLENVINRIGVDRKTQDEVFDISTLHTIEKLISDGYIDIIDFPISTGKEGNVFRGITPKGKLIAIKIYRTSTATFKNISRYIIGDPRFKSIHKTRRDIIYAWTQKEFKNLERLKKIGVIAPKPIVYHDNVLIMEYIGKKNRPACRLRDIKLDNPQDVFDILIDSMKKMYQKAEMVHADFSAFNILFHRDRPYLIDLGQGVLLDHPESDDFLRRDIQNIISYFKKYNIVSDEKKIYKIITTKKW